MFENNKLVSAARVIDRLRADEVIEALKGEGIEAVWRVPHTPALDGIEESWMGERYGEILVLDVNLERARKIAASITGGAL
ncbi:MAG: hypothetical protein NT045_05750 [Candidatus Aureabacteria bacterium]|nr:hypothetical protein [Candidatus Auribacterota bacterium]